MVNAYCDSSQIQQSNPCPEDQSSLTDNPLPLPLPNKAAVRRQRQRVLGQFQTMKEMLHQCQDISVMCSLEETMEGAITILTKSLPKCGPFIREDRNITHIGTNISKKDQEALWRKKVASGRHGKKAETIRNMTTSKGTGELCNMGKDAMNGDSTDKSSREATIYTTGIHAGTTNSHMREGTVLFKKKKLDQLQEDTLSTKRHSCFTCALREFITVGPSTAEPLCNKMSVFWEDYKVGQQQDSHELLQKMFEEIQHRCIRCKEDVIAIKTTTIEILPKNLIVQLQRFSATGTKIMTRMEIHYHLKLGNYASEGMDLHDTAELFAIIVHKGNALSNGHYYCFVEFGNQWYKVDDMRVEEVSHTVFRNCDGQAYLLFYRR
ncbi:USP36_42 [Mytilus coruscus]|uniref:Ubiquitin carboxyl-terminal hydrolase 36 n=1 Tax=Mytilus coruscus TaxID=42192 RepID=A0A6J8CCC5_MYTCO|nr:USP36_42 [Mytilus coruscus]